MGNFLAGKRSKIGEHARGRRGLGKNFARKKKSTLRVASGSDFAVRAPNMAGPKQAWVALSIRIFAGDNQESKSCTPGPFGKVCLAFLPGRVSSLRPDTTSWPDNVGSIAENLSQLAMAGIKPAEDAAEMLKIRRQHSLPGQAP